MSQPSDITPRHRVDEILRKLTFWALMREYGWRRLLLSADVLAPGFLALWVGCLGVREGRGIVDVAKAVAQPLVEASSSLVGLVIAGWAIAAAVGDEEFVGRLYRRNILATLLFPWVLIVGAWVITLLAALILLVMLTISWLPNWAIGVWFSLIVLVFGFSSIASLRQLMSLVRIGILRGLFAERRTKSKGV